MPRIEGCKCLRFDREGGKETHVILNLCLFDMMSMSMSILIAKLEENEEKQKRKRW